MRILWCITEYELKDAHPLMNASFFQCRTWYTLSTQSKLMAFIGFDLVKEYESDFTGPNRVTLTQHSITNLEPKQMPRED